MIGYLNGKLTFKDPTYVIIDVQGVGYEVKTSLQTFSKLKDKEDCLLYTYLHVKEDAHVLYGFFTKDEKQLFLQLISISGVGPNMAMMINSSLDVDELKTAISNGEAGTIQRVKGIGHKTASRIILELKDKISKETGVTGIIDSGRTSLRDEALAALMTLGINQNVANKSIAHVMREHGSDISLEDLIKLVLKQS